MMSIVKVAIALFSASMLFGCESFHQPLKTDKNLHLGVPSTYDYIDKASPNYFLTAYNRSQNRTVERNKIVYELMSIVDDDYSVYERSIRAGKAYKDTVVDITSLTLTTAAAVSTGGAPKILAAVDTALKGSNTSVDKNLLGDRLPEVLLNTMRANRAIVATNIFSRLASPDDSYPLQAALRDINNYYNEGSVTSALVALNASTAQSAKQNAVEADRVQSATVSLGTSKASSNLPPAPAPASSGASGTTR